MNAPTLIVGLGGCGSKVALRVSKMLNEEQKEKIGFAVFDTDVNELRDIEEKSPFVKTIQTSTRLTVGEYLDIDHHSRDNWFPVNAILNSKNLTEGAGQVRAISRLAFETAVRAGKMEPLHKAIENLYKLEGNKYEQALRVIIVSSLAGGTGSGILLPVALYIKNYLATKYRQSSNITRGFFLLPEVFYDVIPGEAEKNNLKSNAYAAIRELDSFLMRGDSTLPERYRDKVNIEFPIAGTDNFESYNIRPYDFCFLFDAQNSDGKQLNSYDEYLDHAANCIYSQSIGPMNKRSNSSEDNTIRKLAAEQGRNRYAGAGCSRLVYPFNDVRDYIALNWTKECVSDQWMKFDNQFEVQLKKNAKQRKDGIFVPDLLRSDSYIKLIEQASANGDSFAKSIITSCEVYEPNSLRAKCKKWDEYMECVRKHINECLEQDSEAEALEEESTSIRSAITNLNTTNKVTQYIDVFHNLEDYCKKIEVYSSTTASTIAYSLFRANEDEDISKETKDFQLEHYFKDSANNFIHPNAIRYFLYNVLKELVLLKKGVDSDVKDLKESFDTFEESTFHDDNSDNVGNAQSLANRKKSLVENFSNKPTQQLLEIAEKYNKYWTDIEDFKEKSILASIYAEAIEYVSDVCNAFESFYKSFTSQIASIKKRISVLERKYYKNAQGNAARYVCASKECLKLILEETPYTDGYNEIDGKLSLAIYNRIRAYGMDKRNEKNERFFNELFENEIVGYFRHSIMKSYSSIVDMDIISAIEKEARYIGECNTDNEVELYTKNVFDECKVLAAPFIEKPIGEDKNPINACTFNDELDPDDDSPRSSLIKKELMNFGGAPDKDIPLNEILFYKSFYGLRATDLSKFAPATETETYSRTEGLYYRAYFDLITKIHPETHKSTVITPHIDKWWHNVSMLPDLDDENQQKQEDDIYAAFFWSMISKQIQLLNDGRKTPVYRISSRLVKELSDKSPDANVLVVSNGTPCDNLYEVIDSLSVYPELVKKILETIDASVKKETENKKNGSIVVSADTGMLAHYLKDFKLLEYPIEEGNPNTSRSIFDLPILVKRSTPNGLYFEEKVIKLLDVTIKEIEKYCRSFGKNETETSPAMGRLVLSEFEKYLNFINAQKKIWPNIVNDVLFVTTYEKIVEFLEDAELDDIVEVVKKKYEAICND